jgi:ferredoxin
VKPTSPLVPVAVVFECPGEPLCAVQANGGDRLVDLCDESPAQVPFSCRSASCGTCRVVIVEGAEHLEPPAEDELELIEILGEDPKTNRLACQARLRPEASGRIVVRVPVFDE